jgi:magnesium transporter
MWRVTGQQRDMFSVMLREDHKLVGPETLRYYIRDVYDHLLRIHDTVNTFRDILSTTLDIYMSAVSNRLNTQVNRLTIITMGIGVMAVITGFYGMNFEHTWPPFEVRWGVPFVLTLMVVTTTIFMLMVYAARRRR